ncbi:MAG: SurA N-terminal domain-containing protein [Anaerolineae bacterium]
MAKRKPKPSKRPIRNQQSRREREQKLERILIWGAVALSVIVVGLLGYGIVMEYFIKPKTPVARVGETEINAQEYQARVRYERIMARLQLAQYDSYLAQFDPNDPNTQAIAQQFQQAKAGLESQLSPEMYKLFGNDVLDRMVEEELVRQEAARRGLTVDEEEIDRQVEQMMGYDRDATPVASAPVTDTQTLTETATTAGTQAPMTQDEFEQIYQTFKNGYLRETGLSEEDFRDILEANLLRTELQNAIGEEMETEVEQVKITYLATETEEAAEALKARIEEGEEVTALVEELASDESELSRGQTLSWYPQDYLTQSFDPGLAVVAFNTPVGEVAEPAASQDGLYYLIYVEGREVRPLDEFLLEQEQQQEYVRWLTEQQDEKVEYLDWESVTPKTP